MKTLKIIQEDGFVYLSSLWERMEVSNEDYEKITSWLYHTKLENWLFSFEDNIEVQESKKNNRLYEIWKEMKLINSQILQLWGTTQIIVDPILESVATAKITDLIVQYNTLKEERDTNYSSSMVEDVFNSIF